MFKYLTAVLLMQSGVLWAQNDDSIKPFKDFTNDVYTSISKEITADALKEGTASPALGKVLEVTKKEFDNLELFTGIAVSSNVVQRISNAFKDVNEDEDNRDISKMYEYVKKADDLFERLQMYYTNRSLFNDEKETLNFVHKATDLPDEMDKLFARRRHIFETVAEDTQGKDGRGPCNNAGFSPQTRFYQFRSIFSVLEARSYVVTAFGYALYSLLEKSNFTPEIGLIINPTIKRINLYLSETLESSVDLPRNIEQCDRKEYLDGIDYIRLSNILWSEDPQDHSIPTASITTNTKDNFVVTGVQWQVQNGILQIQLKEGVLMEQGRIREYSEDLVPLLPYDIRDNKIYDVANDRDLNINQDYFVIEAEAIINVDDIMLPKGYVLTGVRPKVENETISLEIQGTKFDFDSGKLILDAGDSTIWQSAESMSPDLPDRPEQYNHERKPFEEAIYYSSDTAPINEVISDPNEQYIFFWASGKTSNGQIPVVPFFDARAVQSPNAVTSGLGLFRRSHKDYGGYLNFRLYNLNISQYIASNNNGDDYS